MPAAPRRTVRSVLEAFDTTFSSVAASFVRGEYALWLGSGISRYVVPDLGALLRNLVTFLQSHADWSDETCRFRASLAEILEISGVGAPDRAAMDLSTAFDTWPGAPQLLKRMISAYAEILDVGVEGEDDDYLIWTAMDAAETYGSDSLLPDIEHVCIAILMLEGVVRAAPTTNWDGLVEVAMQQLTGDAVRHLRVVVEPSDFLAADDRPQLVKFHGCAVRALADPTNNRTRLIARKSQIAGWTANPDNKLMKHRLEFLFATQPALIVGLSAQDANIHTMLFGATHTLVRVWPTAPPAVVFADEQLSQHHRLVLTATYGQSYSPNRASIQSEALLGAYAKPTLVALVLFTLADKACHLLAEECFPTLGAAEIEALRKCVLDLRDGLSVVAEADMQGFVDGVVNSLGLLLATFRTGEVPSAGRYKPLSTNCVERALHDPNFPRQSFGRLALAVALLAHGHAQGSWTLTHGDIDDPAHGVLRTTAADGRVSKVYVVSDAGVLSRLESNGVVDVGDPDVVVVHTGAVPMRRPRSPGTRFPRTIRPGGREIDLAQVLDDSGSFTELVDAFALAGAMT
jgi:hypothetical protein